VSNIKPRGAAMLKTKLMSITWPAFLSACALELLVFALIDPQDLHLAGRPLALSRQGVYTSAFFVFWLTAMLGTPSAEVNASAPADDADDTTDREVRL